MEGFLDALFAAIGGEDIILFPTIPDEEIVFPQDGRLMHLWSLGLPLPPIFQPVLENPGAYLMPRQAPFEELPEHWEVFSGNNYLGMPQLQEELDACEQVEDMGDEEEELDDDEENYHGMPQLQEELDAAEQVEDMDNAEEDMDNEEENYLGKPQLQEELDAAEKVEDMDHEEEDLDDEGEDSDDEEETMDCIKTSSQDVDAMPSASQHVTKRDVSTTDDGCLLKDIGSSSSFVAAVGFQDPAMPDASPATFVSILEPVTRIVTTSEVQKLNI